MIHAMVFDLDGTLVQTEKLKAISYARAAAQLDPRIDEARVVDEFRQVVGQSRREVAEHLVRAFGLEQAAAEAMEDYSVEAPWQAYVQVRLGIYESMLADDQYILENRWPYNLALVKRARTSCRKLGLATMSYCAQVRRILNVLDLQDTFDFVASRDDVENGKPDPEIYQLMSAALDTPPAECLVIEDSPAGVRAALAAGMHCVAVATPFTRDALRSAGLLDERWIVEKPVKVLETIEVKLREERELQI